MEGIDLKWDPVKLDIVFDGYDLEHELIQGIDTIFQSIDISLRFNPCTIRLINCDQEDVPDLLRNLRDNLENNHKEIILGSIRLSFDYVDRRLSGECTVQAPGQPELTKYIEMELA